MLRYQKLFEYYNGDDTIKSSETPDQTKQFIERINNTIKLIKDRYESTDFMRTVKGRSVSLVTYLPELQKLLTPDYQVFTQYSDETEGGDYFAGFFIPSVEKFKQAMDIVDKSETATFHPQILFESFKVDGLGKVIDPRRKEKFGSDSAYIGKKTTSEIPDQDVERMFRDDSL
jgi:hypothetical protein